MSSLFDQIGLKLNYFPPLVKPGGKLGSFTHEITSYDQEINSVGGYLNANIGLITSLKRAEDWYTNGLGRQIKVYTRSGRIFEGFANTVQINAGAITETRGPLMDIGNRVSSSYTPMDFSVYPPVSGTETVTTIAEDVNSQAYFGIIEKVVAAGQCLQSVAEQVRDVFLQDYSWPETSGPLSIAPGSAQNPAVTLSILGNIHWLSAYIFEDLTTGLIYISDKIKNVITADPNGYLSTNFDHIDDNLFLVEQMDITQRFGFDIITDLLTLGNDTDDSRRLFGVYDDLTAFYSAIPSTVAYRHRLSDPAQRITGTGNITILPWNVRPGKWLLVPDFLPGFIPPTSNTRSDPRLKLLESVKYTAPWSLDLSGGKTDRLSQMLAKITFNGGFL